jgi:hypothetical protein
MCSRVLMQRVAPRTRDHWLTPVPNVQRAHVVGALSSSTGRPAGPGRCRASPARGTACCPRPTPVRRRAAPRARSSTLAPSEEISRTARHPGARCHLGAGRRTCGTGSSQGSCVHVPPDTRSLGHAVTDRRSSLVVQHATRVIACARLSTARPVCRSSCGRALPARSRHRRRRGPRVGGGPRDCDAGTPPGSVELPRRGWRVAHPCGRTSDRDIRPPPGRHPLTEGAA